MTEKNEIKTNTEVETVKKTLATDILLFVDAYIAGATPEAAYIAAGLGVEDGANNTERARALLDTPRVKLYRDALDRCVASRSVTTLEVIDQKLTDMAMVDAIDIVDTDHVVTDDDGNPMVMIALKDPENLTAAQRSAIQSIEPVMGGGIKVKMVDKLKAMDMLIKRRGGYKEVIEQNVTGNVRVFAMTGDNGRGPNKG